MRVAITALIFMIEINKMQLDVIHVLKMFIMFLRIVQITHFSLRQHGNTATNQMERGQITVFKTQVFKTAVSKHLRWR